MFYLQVEEQLDRRALKVSRRPGNAKASRNVAAAEILAAASAKKEAKEAAAKAKVHCYIYRYIYMLSYIDRYQ